MSAPGNKAVFLSYASQDAEPARCICEALRAAGVEVWFDQSELVGGDVWDAKIRKQIRDCALFIPVISANTQARTEGYFRLEWRLADQRTHLMAKGRPFLVPVVIDATRDAEAHVPDSFTEVQWTRLPGGETSAAFGERVKKLLSAESGAGVSSVTVTQGQAARATPTHRTRSARWLAAGAILLACVLAVVIGRPWRGVATPQAGVAADSLDPVRRARALIDDDLMAVRENFRFAEELCQRAIAADSMNAEAWATLARVSAEFIRRSYDSSAERQLALRTQAERAIRLAPDSIEASLAYTEYLGVADENAEREQRLRTLIEKAPMDARVARALARALTRVDKHAEASEVRLKHPSFRGRDPRPLLEEVSAPIERSLREREALIDRAQALAPTPEGYRAKLRHVAFVWGDLEAAKAYIEQIPPAVLREDVFISLVAQVWLRLGDGDRALTVLQRAPQDFFEEARQVLPKGYVTGWAHHIAGRPAAAQAEWKQALDVVEKRLERERERGRTLFLNWKAQLQALVDQRDAALRTWELQVQLEAGRVPPTGIRFLILTGRHEDAVKRLQEEYAGGMRSSDYRRAETLNIVRYEPAYAPIRADPRVQALIAEETAWLTRARHGGADGSAQTPSAATPAPRKSVAVLAFRQLSADSENEYLCEAISDELSSVLGRVPGLKVAASASAFSFKGKRVRPSEMAAQLGVAYLVDGTVQKFGSRVRVRAELIQASDESVVWKSNTLEHDVKDMFAVQDQVVAAIAQSLQLQLGGGKTVPLTIDPEAYRLYYEGRRMWSMRGAQEPVNRARALFEQALQKDPNLGRAYAGLADTLIVENTGFFGARNSAEAAEAQRLTEKAIALEPLSVETQTSHGAMLWRSWRLTEAERTLRQALELNPNHAEAHLYLGRLLHVDGRLDESLVEFRKAVELDPLTSRIFDNDASVLIDIGRFEEALRSAERALALQPESLGGQRAKVLALSGLGRHDEALAIGRETAHATHFVTGIALARAGRRDEAREWLKNYSGHVVGKTIVLLALGERDAALDNIPVDQVSMGAIGRWFYWPELDPVRNDPRFLRVLEQVGMRAAHDRAQAWRAAHMRSGSNIGSGSVTKTASP